MFKERSPAVPTTNEEPPQPTKRLFVIVTPDDPTRPIYERHPQEGMVLCAKHVEEIKYCFDPTVREVGENESLLRRACAMCGVASVVGNVCCNDDCKTPLPSQWPAVYCSNRCALDDA